MELTFDRAGGELSEETNGHLEDVGFLQFGVAGVVLAHQRQDEGLQTAEAVVDSGAPFLFKQRFERLERSEEEEESIVSQLFRGHTFQ